MTDLRKQKTSDTTISNQDKTVTANGEYTADENYTGLGTVTVAVPMKALRITKLGCNISDDYIASNFHGYDNDSSSVFGGFTFNSGGKFLNEKILHQHFSAFQIAFKTPATKQATVLCQGSSSATNSLSLTLNADFSKITVSSPNFINKSADYAFDADTWYIVRYKQQWSSADGWQVITSISADGGENFTVLKTESGRFDTDSNGITYYLADTQFGYKQNQNIAFEIDLKNTGFIDYNNDFTYMFAEAA
ncbi:MAG: hypothetical protein K6C94_02310 [Candidatus Gastranaerophilales bacterium]|nr:hypothetical protein [Candidatus Gastranaerophilales bacterium]